MFFEKLNKIIFRNYHGITNFIAPMKLSELSVEVL